MKKVMPFLLILLLTACASIQLIQSAPNTVLPGKETSPDPTINEAPCAFMDGRQSLPDISGQLLEKLKRAGLPAESARVEAYGENCITEDGTFVRFSARETDYYVTLAVPDLQDEANLGDLLMVTFGIIAEFPVSQTPGPNPGYVGINFQSSNGTRNLWVARNTADELLAKGLKGAEFFRAISPTP